MQSLQLRRRAETARVKCQRPLIRGEKAQSPLKCSRLGIPEHRILNGDLQIDQARPTISAICSNSSEVSGHD
ncbi:hypothetical protein D3C84_685490 [compost metagenome]